MGFNIKKFSEMGHFDKIKAFDKRGELIGKMFKIAETDFRESGFCNSKKHVGWCVPDPLCMLCYLYPEIVEEIESVQTGICTTGEGRGATMVDWFGRYNVGKTQNWVVEVDHDKVENLFLQLLAN
ncbi:Inosine-uridine preferring nucleoside hydrolase [Entamoeba marina]